MLSEGGSAIGTSFLRSPCVGLAWFEEVVLEADPKRAIGGFVCGVVDSGSREVVNLMGLA